MEDGMLFTASQKELFLAMARFQKFRDQRSTVLYMEYVYFESDGQAIKFSMSDMENTAVLELPGVKHVEKAFKICIEKTFMLPLNTLDCDISFELSGEVCIMHSPDGKVAIPTLEATNFPRPAHGGEKIFNIPEGWLLETINTLIPFTHPDPLVSNNALHFKFNDGSLRMGAYDGVICAATQVRLEAENEQSFMISRKSASMLAGVLNAGSNVMCTVSIKHHDIIFMMEHGTISCRKMVFADMPMPNDYFRMAMPYVSKEADIMFFEDKEYLMGQLHKATVFNTKANQVVRLNLARNLVTIEVDDTLMGRRSVQECTVLFKHDGDTQVALVNCNKFMTLVRAVPGESFELRVPLENGPGENCIGIPLSVETEKYVFIIATLTT